MDAKDLIRELSQQGRIEILRNLRGSPRSPSELSKMDGLTLSTASRALNRLSEFGVVERDDHRCRLTGFGVAIEKILSVIEHLYEYREDIMALQDFIAILPPGFVAGFHNLRKAKVMSLEEAFEVGVEKIASSKRYGLYIDKVISHDLYRVMAERNLAGVEERVISNHATIHGRANTFKKVLMDMDLTAEEYDTIASKVRVRVFDTPIQLGIIDGEFALLQLNDTLDRFYVSDDRDFVRWCEYLFWYLWERSEDANFPKIVEEVKAEKGLV
ncbi:helix-turn-helix domain-containing protein [Geoglobus ahangari]